MLFADYFSVQVFFLVFREVLESAIIVSVLLTFLKKGDLGRAAQTSVESRKVYNRLRMHVWVGAALGIVICLVIGGVFLLVFYLVGTNLWNRTEKLWEAFFCILAAVMITFMGRAMLRLNKMEEKWRVKLASLIVNQYVADDEGQLQQPKTVRGRLRQLNKKYAMALLPLVTTLREGLEAVAFLGGLGASQPSTSFPLAVLTAVSLGVLVGVAMYQYGANHVSVRYFVIGSTCFLYLVAAGLFSRGVWFYEMHQFVSRVGADVTESGSGPGSYDISRSVWHVNCCNPETDGPFMIFNALLGWQNSATYGSVISYNLYWVFVMLMVLRMMYKEQRMTKSRALLDEETTLIDRASDLIARRGN